MDEDTSAYDIMGLLLKSTYTVILLSMYTSEFASSRVTLTMTEFSVLKGMSGEKYLVELIIG